MTCAKQMVIATLVAKDSEVFVGENLCDNPQQVCPRAHLPTGVGYEMCIDICKQTNHAEVNAIKLAGDKAVGSVIYLKGHTYACDSCKSAAFDAGVESIVIL